MFKIRHPSAIFLFGLFLALLTACQNGQQRHESELLAYPGYTGIYEGFTLVLDDRFDRFNDAYWQKGDGAVGGESMCRFQEQGVQVVDGILELVIREEWVKESWSEDHQQMKGDYDYSGGEIRTRPDKKIKYGRIETRMRAPTRASASGYISSLFTYVNQYDPEAVASEIEMEWEEIDIELEGGRPDKFQANLIYGINTWEWWRTRVYGAWEDKIEVGPVDDWRVFAIEWLPDRISWYVDGKRVKTLHQSDIDCTPECIEPQKHPAPIPDNYADLIMNFWIPNDEIQNDFGGNKERNVYPMKTCYDWIRYYQYDAEPVSNWP